MTKVKNNAGTRTLVDAVDKAIIWPLFNARIVKSILVLALITIVMLVFLIPDTVESCKAMCGILDLVYATAFKVPEVGNMAKTSVFPLALSVSYFSALAMGIVGALIVLFMRLKTFNLSAFDYSNWKMVLMRWGAYLLWSLQFIYASQPGSPHGRIHLVTAAIGAQRWALLWFSISIYVVSLGVTIALFCELKYFLTRGKE